VQHLGASSRPVRAAVSRRLGLRDQAAASLFSGDDPALDDVGERGQWGGAWTLVKLDALKSYLKFCTTSIRCSMSSPFSEALRARSHGTGDRRQCIGALARAQAFSSLGDAALWSASAALATGRTGATAGPRRKMAPWRSASLTILAAATRAGSSASAAIPLFGAAGPAVGICARRLTSAAPSGSASQGPISSLQRPPMPRKCTDPARDCSAAPARSLARGKRCFVYLRINA